MDFLTIGGLAIVLLLVLMGTGINVGLAFILAGFVSSLFLLGLDAGISLLGESAYSTIARPTWVALPLFILMGAICANGGLARRAYDGAFTLIRNLPGSLLIATCLSSGLMGAVSGSSIATTTMFGRMAMPEMSRFGYNQSLAAGCIAASGTFASMIPPSIMLIIYALFTNQSVAALFAAGIIPGILTIFAYSAAIIILVTRKPHLAPSEGQMTMQPFTTGRSKTIIAIWPIVLIAGVVLGGIYGGILTPTEAAAAGVFLSLIVTLLLPSSKGGTSIWDALGESARTTATLFLLIIGALYFSRVMAITDLPQELTRKLIGLEIPPTAILLGMLIIIFLLGMIMIPVGIFALTLPIIMPVLLEMGYDPIWFGIIMLKLTEIAAITPPIGLNVFAMKSAAPKITLSEIYRGCSFFLIVDLLVLLLLIAFPQIVLWLPGLL